MTSGFIYSLFCLEQLHVKVHLAGISGHHPLVDVFSVFPRLYSGRDLVLRAEALKALVKVFSHGKGTAPKAELNPGTWDFNYMLFKIQTGCFSLLHCGGPCGSCQLSLQGRVTEIKVTITPTCTICFLDWAVLWIISNIQSKSLMGQKIWLFPSPSLIPQGLGNPLWQWTANTHLSCCG